MTHPNRCVCAGTGHRPAEPLWSRTNGHPHRYSTVKPCDHDWWNDDPTEEALPQDHPRAQAAFARGYTKGLAELDELKKTWTPPQ